jgi:hypothetical protein
VAYGDGYELTIEQLGKLSVREREELRRKIKEISKTVVFEIQ